MYTAKASSDFYGGIGWIAGLLLTMLVSIPLWLYLGFQSNVWGFIGLLVCGFAFGGVIQFVLRSARRAAGPDKSLWSGLGRAFTGSRTRTAAYVVAIDRVATVTRMRGMYA